MPDPLDCAVGDEVTVTWRAHTNQEWTMRGRVDRFDERYLRLRDLHLGLILIPCFEIISLQTHGLCPWGPPYKDGRVTWRKRKRKA